MAMTNVHPPGKLDGNRIAVQMFAPIFRAFMECSDQVQSEIKEMVAIAEDPASDQDERDAAIATISEALFPSKQNGELVNDLDELDQIEPDELRPIVAAMDKQEQAFADRLADMMDQAGMTQESLAEAIGVRQPAVSMMLNRSCRPQRRTVEKIAKALNVSPETLWPGYKPDMGRTQT